MTNSLTAGFIQFNPQLGEQEKNITLLEKLIMKGKDAQLLVIPELANSGYNFESKKQAFSLAENTANSIFLDFLSDQAKQYNLFIVAGLNEEEDGKLYNTSLLVGPKGLIGKYRKIHLFWNEFDFFEKGNLGLPVFDIGITRIGMLICFDWIFPEVWRILALKGAEVICHPSNLIFPYAQQAVPVHGLINKTFNITANRYGTERSLTFSGQSILSDPTGQTLIKAGKAEDEVLWTGLDLDQARNKQITPRNHVLNDRIPEHYRELIDPLK